MVINKDNWDKISAAYEAALALPVPERKNYLHSILVNTEVDQILALLNAEEAANKFSDNTTEKIRHQYAETLPLTGQVIGNFVIEELIGSGGMADVYIGSRHDERFTQKVAIKILKQHYNHTVLQQFKRERSLLSSLSHRGIAKIFDGGVLPNGQPYFVMEYIEGKHLLAYVNKEQLDLKDRLRLFLEICATVGYAHQNMIIHRDIKPSNILINQNGQVKLLDFGIAKSLDQSSHDQEATQTGFSPLTISYASPEQIENNPLNLQTDIFTLGRLLYQLISGNSPYQEDSTAYERVNFIKNEQLPLASDSISGENQSHSLPYSLNALRGDLDCIIKKAMQYAPSNRYSTVKELAQDIISHLNNKPIIAKQESIFTLTGKLIKRNPITSFLSILLFILATSFTANTYRDKNEIVKQRDALIQERERSNQLSSVFFETLKLSNPKDKPFAMSLVANAGNNIAKLEKFSTLEHAYFLKEIATLQENLYDFSGYLVTTSKIIELQPAFTRDERTLMHIKRAEILNRAGAYERANAELNLVFPLLINSKDNELHARAYNEKALLEMHNNSLINAESAIETSLYYYSKHEAAGTKMAIGKSTLSQILVRQGRYKQANKILEEVCLDLFSGKDYKVKDVENCIYLNGGKK